MKKVVLCIISFYQNAHILHSVIRRLFFLSDSICKFTPTCSQYSYRAVEKYGVIKGLWLSLKRILKCHPFSKGGHDPLK